MAEKFPTLLNVKNGHVLRRLLKSLNVQVPPRHLGRETWHAEFYAIVRLLKTLPRSRLPFPFTFLKDESPDFILEQNGEKIAIEHTEAVSQLEAHRSSVLGKLIASGAKVDPVQSVILRSPNDFPLKRTDIVAHPNNPPRFYIGDSVEKNWVIAMRHFIDKKLAKFPDYEQCGTKWLLIYDNWPSAALDLRDACEKLHRQLPENNTFSILNSIFIIHSTELVELTHDNITIRTLKSPPLSRYAKQALALLCHRRQRRIRRKGQ